MLSTAVVLMVLGGFLVLSNWWMVYWSYRTKKFYSPVPFTYAVMLLAGMLMEPATHSYAWIALVID